VNDDQDRLVFEKDGSPGGNVLTSPDVKGGMTAMRLGTILLGVALLGAGPSAAATQVGPDQPKPDMLVWGKEVNGLAVSLTPEGKDQKFIVRWKNVSNETLELPWVRFGSNAIYKGLDDLLNHVYLKKPDGTFVPARKYQFPIIGGPPYRPRTVILAPGKIHQETIDLWTYVDKTTDVGPYQLWVELEIKSGYAPSQPGARYWTGKVQSNVVEVKLGK
jgi:hypothetical protein